MTEHAAPSEEDEKDDGDWRKAWRRIAGMWKDRDDLPDFDELRKTWDRNPWESE
jgi:hypothetical protein